MDHKSPIIAILMEICCKNKFRLTVEESETEDNQLLITISESLNIPKYIRKHCQIRVNSELELVHDPDGVFKGILLEINQKVKHGDDLG